MFSNVHINNKLVHVWSLCCGYFSVAKLCPTLCNPMGCSMPGFSALHYLLEFAQTHAHGVGDSVAPWTTAPQAPLSFTVSWGLLRLMPTESVILWPHGLQHSRLPCPSLSPEVCSDSCPLRRWCCLTISSSVVPFFSCPQSFQASGSFPMSQFFTSDGQSTEASASASVLPMNI